MILEALVRYFLLIPLMLVGFLWGLAIDLGALAYGIMLVMIIIGLYRLKYNHAYRGQGFIPPDKLPTLSIIIAARNEEQYIGRTLDAALSQDYPPEKFDVTVIDDRSTDRTATIIEEYSRKDSRVRLIRQTEIVESKSPKKQALTLGIGESEGSVIVMTDADCTPAVGWLTSLMKFMGPGVDMVIGQARFDIGDRPPLWQRLQALDFRSQGIAAAGLVAAGKPFNCCGASLAFTRKLYDDVGGWKGVDTLVSGDDELLMAKAHHAGFRVVAATGGNTVVNTRPAQTPGELWHQRIRWGSKGMHYSTFRKVILTGVFLFMLALASAPLLGIIPWMNLDGRWAVYWLVKVGLDFIAMYHGSYIFEERFNFIDFLITEILHPFAIVAFVIGGHFTAFEWKGQRFRTTGAVRT